jgi:pentatricopeptide repeat protein
VLFMRSGRLAACEEIYKQMQQAPSATVTRVATNVLMQAALECGNPGRAVELFDEMLARHEEGASPEADQHAEAAEAAPSSRGTGDEEEEGGEEAAAATRQPVAAGAPDAVSYVTAINSAGQALQPDKAERYFGAMRAMDTGPLEERTWCEIDHQRAR